MADEVKIDIVTCEGFGPETTARWIANPSPLLIRLWLAKWSRNGRYAYCKVNGRRVRTEDIGRAISDAQKITPPAGQL
jgi:hypothetical protein